MSIVDEIKANVPSILAGDSETLVDSAEKFGRHLAENDMKTSQIRKIFGEVKKMQGYDKNALNLLRPKLAYTAGRHKKVRDLQEVLDEAIKMIDDQSKFENFRNFFEAIVAYHKKYGGKD